MEKEELHVWLQSRERKYARGVELFEAFASEDQKHKLLPYFREVTDTLQFDSHFTILVNKLSAIARLVGIQPVIVIDNAPQGLIKSSNKNKNNDSLTDVKSVPAEPEKSSGYLMKNILIKESELINLEDRIKNLEDGSDNKDSDIYDLSDNLSILQKEISSLKDRYAVLKPSEKIVTTTDMPVNIREIFDRIRKITPLYAS